MDEYISKQAAVDAGYLSDWYIASVGDESPVWTDAHIDELLNDFIVIPKDTPSADVQPVNQWISVKDRLPEENILVLCYARSTTGEGNNYFLGALAHGEFWFFKVNDIGHASCPVLHWEVTHWQQLPESPKED